jgi:hypothetical protein
MDELTESLSTLMTPETMSKLMAKAQSAMDRDRVSTQSKSISMLPPDPKTAGSFLNPNDVDITDPARCTEFLKSIKESASKLRFPYLDTLPCANVQVDKYEVCNKPGTQACSECRLVSYCSKVESICVSLVTSFDRSVGMSESALEVT